MSSSTPYKLFQYVDKSRSIILDMLEDRGFNVSNYRNNTMDEIKTMLIAQQSNNYTTKADIGPLDIFVKKNSVTGTSEEKLLVKYRLDAKFKERENLVSQINDIYTTILDKNDCLIILNIYRVISKVAMQGAKTDGGSDEYSRQLYISKGYFVQFFGLENFLFNVSKHQFVPKHTIATKEEITAMMTHYNIKNVKNLPTIKWQDPQAKYIGLKPKMITKIYGFSATTGESIRYRLCVL